MEDAKVTLIQLLKGILIYTILVGVVGAFFIDKKVIFLLGVLYGAVASIIFAVHLYFSLDKSLDLDAKSAANREQKMAMVRMIIMIAVVSIGFSFPSVFHIGGIILGLFGLKVSALIQPHFHNYRLKEKGR